MEKLKAYLDENLWEEFVYSHPKKFLNETLKKVSKQETLPSGRSDLTFRDSEKRLVIVELQMNALDRKHLAQTIEYKMDWEKRGEKNIRMILLCNEIRENRKPYIEKWDKKFNLNLETISISKKEVKKMIQSIDPRIEFTENSKNQNYFGYDRKGIVEHKKKEKIEKKNDFEEAGKFIDDKKYYNNLKSQYKNYNRILNPYIVSKENIIYYENPHKFIKNYNEFNFFKGKPISAYLAGIYNEVDEMYKIDSRWVVLNEAKSTIKNISYELENPPQYRKILFDPYIINHKKFLKEKKNKPEIDLLICQDAYFGRKTFKLYWQPSNWKYDRKIEDGKEKWVPLSDFVFPKQYGDWFHYKKKDHLLADIKFAFGEYFGDRDIGIKNFWGRIGICILRLIQKYYEELSQNFEVNIKGSFKFFIDDLTHEEKLLLREKKIENLENYKVIYDYMIEDASRDLGPEVDLSRIL